MIIPSALPTIRQRLTTSLLSISLLFSALTAGVTWLIVKHELNEFLNHELKETGELIEHLIVSMEAQGLSIHALQLTNSKADDDQLAWQVMDASFDRVLAKSHRAPDQPLLNQPAPIVKASLDLRWNALTIPIHGAPGRWLVVAQSNAEHQEVQHETVAYTLLASSISSFFVALFLGLGIRRELKPLTDLSHQVRNYNPLIPGSALPSVNRQELVPIHGAFIDLGDRLTKRMASEQAFLAHAAHALRTPVAGIDAQLAIAIKESCDHPMQHRLRLARHAAMRLGAIMRALLTLFRSGLEIHCQTVELHALVDAHGWIGLQVEIQAEGPVRVDPDLFSAVFFNLLDNAQRHQAQHVRVVMTPIDHQMVRIRISDDGKGCSPKKRSELRSALLDPFSSPLGHGLGLTLARLVMRAHQGYIDIVSEGEGFTIDLIGPLADLNRPSGNSAHP